MLTTLPSSNRTTISLLTENSSSYRIAVLHNTYFLQGRRNLPPAAEEVETLLEMHHMPFDVHAVAFHYRIPLQHTSLLEEYLNACIRKRHSLSEWMTFCEIRSFLESSIEGKNYRFPQEIHFIALSPAQNIDVIFSALSGAENCQLPEHPFHSTRTCAMHPGENTRAAPPQH